MNPVRVRELRIDGVRNLVGVQLVAGPRVNFFCGENAAGKTSVLEALHCLAVGRSFRGGRHGWIAQQAKEAHVFAMTDEHRLGLSQSRRGWVGRVDGLDCLERARFSEHLPIFTFHPEAHALVEGEPSGRRRLMDLGVFHGEQRFLEDWRRFRRALGQRNASLRAGEGEALLRAWDRELVEAGEAITRMRGAYVTRLNTALQEVLAVLELRVPALDLGLMQGWPEEFGLAESLARGIERDRSRGFTQVGPQRADLRIRDARGSVAGRLSRGQQKLVALGLVMAQARLFEAMRGRAAVFLFDDVGSELDRGHEERVGTWLVESPWQVWMTGLAPPAWLGSGQGGSVFHVEQGVVQPA